MQRTSLHSLERIRILPFLLLPTSSPLIKGISDLLYYAPYLVFSLHERYERRLNAQIQNQLLAQLSTQRFPAQQASSFTAHNQRGPWPQQPPSTYQQIPPNLLRPSQADEARFGCKYWNGSQGSCFKDTQCPFLASHIPGRPSQLYQLRAPQLAAAGMVEGPLGFIRSGQAGARSGYAAQPRPLLTFQPKPPS